MFLTCGQTYLPLENFQCLHYFYFYFFYLRPLPTPFPYPSDQLLPLKERRKRFIFWGGSHDSKFWRFLIVFVRCYSSRQLRPQGDFQQIGLIIPNSCWFVERFTWCFLKIVDVDLNHYLWEYLEEGSKTDRPKKVVNLWGVKMVIK